MNIRKIFALVLTLALLCGALVALTVVSSAGETPKPVVRNNETFDGSELTGGVGFTGGSVSNAEVATAENGNKYYRWYTTTASKPATDNDAVVRLWFDEDGDPVAESKSKEFANYDYFTYDFDIATDSKWISYFHIALVTGDLEGGTYTSGAIKNTFRLGFCCDDGKTLYGWSDYLDPWYKSSPTKTLGSVDDTFNWHHVTVLGTLATTETDPLAETAAADAKNCKAMIYIDGIPYQSDFLPYTTDASTWIQALRINLRTKSNYGENSSLIFDNVIAQMYPTDYAYADFAALVADPTKTLDEVNYRNFTNETYVWPNEVTPAEPTPAVHCNETFDSGKSVMVNVTGADLTAGAITTTKNGTNKYYRWYATSATKPANNDTSFAKIWFAENGAASFESNLKEFANYAYMTYDFDIATDSSWITNFSMDFVTKNDSGTSCGGGDFRFGFFSDDGKTLYGWSEKKDPYYTNKPTVTLGATDEPFDWHHVTILGTVGALDSGAADPSKCMAMVYVDGVPYQSGFLSFVGEGATWIEMLKIHLKTGSKYGVDSSVIFDNVTAKLYPKDGTYADFAALVADPSKTLDAANYRNFTTATYEWPEKVKGDPVPAVHCNETFDSGKSVMVNVTGADLTAGAITATKNGTNKYYRWYATSATKPKNNDTSFAKIWLAPDGTASVESQRKEFVNYAYMTCDFDIATDSSWIQKFSMDFITKNDSGTSCGGGDFRFGFFSDDGKTLYGWSEKADPYWYGGKANLTLGATDEPYDWHHVTILGTLGALDSGAADPSKCMAMVYVDGVPYQTNFLSFVGDGATWIEMIKIHLKTGSNYGVGSSVIFDNVTAQFWPVDYDYADFAALVADPSKTLDAANYRNFTTATYEWPEKAPCAKVGDQFFASFDAAYAYAIANSKTVIDLIDHATVSAAVTTAITVNSNGYSLTAPSASIANLDVRLSDDVFEYAFDENAWTLSSDSIYCLAPSAANATSAKIKGLKQNVSLFSDFVLHLFVPKAAGDITVNGIAPAETRTIGDKEYCVAAAEVASNAAPVAKEFVISFTAGGKDFTETVSLDVVSYAKSLLAANSETALANAMLNYAKAAYGDGELKAVFDGIAAPAGNAYNEAKNLTDTTVIKGAALNLDADPDFVFVVAEGFVGSVKFTYQNARTSAPEEVVVKVVNGKAVLENMRVFNMADEIAVAYKAAGATDFTSAGSYNLAAYAASDAGQSVEALVHALYDYALAAKAYVTAD